MDCRAEGSQEGGGRTRIPRSVIFHRGRHLVGVGAVRVRVRDALLSMVFTCEFSCFHGRGFNLRIPGEHHDSSCTLLPGKMNKT